MKRILVIALTASVLAGNFSCAQPGNTSAAKTNKAAEDSIKFRRENIDKWFKELQANNDSLVKFGFYLNKDYLELKKKLTKYEKVSEAELLIDELNDLMFSGGDPVHNPSNMANAGEVGHFFKETKKELDDAGIKYEWDTTKVRYVLIPKK